MVGVYRARLGGAKIIVEKNAEKTTVSASSVHPHIRLKGPPVRPILSPMLRSLAKALESRTLVFDGGMGTQIHACADCMPSDYLGRDNCTDILVKSRPDIIQRIHETYFAAGADVVETDSFGANILVGREFDEDLAAWTFELNKRAAEIARAAAAKFETADRPRFAIGSMGPGTKLVSLGQV